MHGWVPSSGSSGLQLNQRAVVVGNPRQVRGLPPLSLCISVNPYLSTGAHILSTGLCLCRSASFAH
jgi:hypothetical protein